MGKQQGDGAWRRQVLVSAIQIALCNLVGYIPCPGEILRDACFAPLGLGVSKAAAALGISRKTLSAILNGRQGISPEMALRLSLAFDTTAESWLQQQNQYDLWQARHSGKRLRVKRLAA